MFGRRHLQADQDRQQQGRGHRDAATMAASELSGTVQARRRMRAHRLACQISFDIVGECAPLAEMPACSLGLASTKDGLPVYILLCPQLYDRPGNPYGDASGRDWPDNDVRFGRLASAAAQPAAGLLDKNWAADLVHANDWQSALVPAYLAWNAINIPTILTIHNPAYQGLFPKESLRRIQEHRRIVLPESTFSAPMIGRVMCLLDWPTALTSH